MLEIPDVGPLVLTVPADSPIQLLKLDRGRGPPRLGRAWSRYRLRFAVALPLSTAKQTGVLVHAPAKSAFQESEPALKEGVALWVETDKNGGCRYHIGGKDLASGPQRSAWFA